MTASTNDPENSSSSAPSGRFGAIAIVALALLVVAGGAVAYLLLRGDGDEAAATAETLVVLDEDELRHIGSDGEVAASFTLDLDTRALTNQILVGSHLVGILDGEVIAIDAADGGVLRFDLPETADLVPTAVLGQTDLVAIGSPLGTNVLDVVDLRTGSRHHLAGPSGEALFTLDSLVASPDGSRVGVRDLRPDAEKPTVIVSLDDGDRLELPGYLAGLTDDRAITSEPQPDTSELLLRWFDEAGEETWRTNLERPDVAAAMPDGSVVFAVGGAFHRVREGGETPEILDGADLAPDDSRFILPVGSSGGMILLTSEEVRLLDGDATLLASGPAPDPWVYERSRTTERCLVIGPLSRPSVVFDLDRGEALTDGTVPVFAQSPGDGCTLVTGNVGDDEAEYSVSGTDVSHITEPDLRVSGVSSAGDIVAISEGGVVLLPADSAGEWVQISDGPVWHRFVALDR